jgi:uncharacterized repeat protein (TIGR02543 family)
MRFEAWYTSPDYTTKYDFTSPVTSNLTLYARWQYIIKFNTNGATSPAINDQLVFPNSKATSPTSPPTKPGLHFEGWYTNPDFATNPTATAYDFNTPITSSFTLYAKWVYVITFQTYAGTTIASQDVLDGAKVTRPPTNPTKPNLVFDNWYANSDVTTLYDFNTPITSNLTLYAKWVSTINVHYLNIQTAATASPPTTNYGQPETEAALTNLRGGKGDVSASISPPTITGYRLEDDPDKWDQFYDTYRSSIPTLSLSDISASPRRLSWPSTGVSHHYYLYQKTWQVSFNTHNSIPVPTQTVDDTKTITPPTPTSDNGLPFKGWYTDTSFTTPYDFTTPITSDLTLHARWALDMIVDPGNGDPSYTIEVTKGSNMYCPDSLPGTEPHFSGWYLDPTFTKLCDPNQIIEDDVKLYGRWSYWLDFVSNGGQPVPVSQEITVGQTPTKPTTPMTNQDLNFFGWYLDDTSFTQVYDFTTPPTSDQTIYAKWGYRLTTHPGGNEDPITIEGQPGQIIPCPTPLNDQPDAHFDDWYLDPDFKTKCVTNFILDSDTNLYAKWYNTIDFITNTDTKLPSQTVLHGQTSTPPPQPTHPDHLFSGWYQDASFMLPHDWTKPVTKDLVLYAKWTKAPLVPNTGLKRIAISGVVVAGVVTGEGVVMVMRRRIKLK